MANRLGRKCFVPDAATEHHFKRDSQIWAEGRGMSPSFPDLGVDLPRAPIAEIGTLNDHPGSGNGVFISEDVLELAQLLIVAPALLADRIPEVMGICVLMMKTRIFRGKVDCLPIHSIRPTMAEDLVSHAANPSSQIF